MIYLNENDIQHIEIDWNNLVQLMTGAVTTLHAGDFSQPMKPYLRFKNLKNRIISMPAYLGGMFDVAGIKWIASFPDNIHASKPRAHSVVILNDADSGEPVCIINTALLSIIRTASVSGLIISNFDRIRGLQDITIGIIGWGPIGRQHLKMCVGLLGKRISKVVLHDVRGIDRDATEGFGVDTISVADSWRDVYAQSDIFITCTTASAPYIDEKPKPGSLHLNVSLRDYKVDVFDYFKNTIIVDNWEEICRENTDIEQMHIQKGLCKEDTKSITDVIIKDCIMDYNSNDPVLFNPMGMAIFDIALGNYYYKKANQLKVGLVI
jgi:ornithine cyclodeaminase